MSGLKDDTIGGFNSMIEKQKKGTQILYESVAKAVCHVRASAPLSTDWSEEINAD